MADLYTFRGNFAFSDLSANPYECLGRFSAGASVPIERGDILLLAGGIWGPIGSTDGSMAGVIAVAAEKLVTGSLAGRYPIWVPRPGDVWEYELAAASNPALGASLYPSADQAVATSGSNVLAYVVDHPGFTQQQGRADVGDVLDRGSGATVTNVNRVLLSFRQAASYFAALHG